MTGPFPLLFQCVFYDTDDLCSFSDFPAWYPTFSFRSNIFLSIALWAVLSLFAVCLFRDHIFQEICKLVKMFNACFVSNFNIPAQYIFVSNYSHTHKCSCQNTSHICKHMCFLQSQFEKLILAQTVFQGEVPFTFSENSEAPGETKYRNAVDRKNSNIWSVVLIPCPTCACMSPLSASKW